MATLVSSLMLASPVLAGDHPHWSYAGEHGPDRWGGLCSSGQSQSPIDVRGAVSAQLAPLEFDYRTRAAEVLNNGHTVQVAYAAGSGLKLDTATYELKQFHFHAPSENLLEGRQFPLEVHFVHADAAGNLAVVAVFFEEGTPNAGLSALSKNLPAYAGEKHLLATKLSALALLPASREYYRFSGSLTTPPCSEGVNWLVLKQPLTASTGQIAQFGQAMGPNARPTQPLNGRVIEQ